MGIMQWWNGAPPSKLSEMVFFPSVILETDSAPDNETEGIIMGESYESWTITELIHKIAKIPEIRQFVA